METPATLRAVIVDDEPLARDGLRLLLEQEPGVVLEKSCASGQEAVQAVHQLQPDVLFLDIEMPTMNGFDVIRAINPRQTPQIVFVTAYDEYAVEAFRFHALDYLLKPVHRDRLKDSLSRLRGNLQQHGLKEYHDRLGQLLNLFQSNSQGPLNGSAGSADRIIVKSHGHVYFLTVPEIIWVEASGDYVTIHTAKRSHLLRETMLNMEKRLAPFGFRRIHRSSIINLDYVSELKSSRNNDYQVVLSDGTALNLGRSFKDELYASLSATD